MTDVLVPHPHVRIEIASGTPYVIGSRVPVRRLWAFYKSGSGIDRLLRRYPQLGAAKVFDALSFALDNPELIAADLAREEQLLREAGVR